MEYHTGTDRGNYGDILEEISFYMTFFVDMLTSEGTHSNGMHTKAGVHLNKHPETGLSEPNTAELQIRTESVMQVTDF